MALDAVTFPEGALRLLRTWRRRLIGGGMLIGVDTVKDDATLHAAYNDSAGVHFLAA